MDFSQSQIALRKRTDWEAMDVGIRLWATRKWTYLFVWLCLSAPVVLLLSALFWASPWWAGFFIWWLKPVFEAPILVLLSRQAFAPLPGFVACLRLAARALWRPKVLADITWRRFLLSREMVLPIVMLEQLHGQPYALRRRELSLFGGRVAVWLTFLGFHIEMIFLYGGIMMLYLVLYSNPVQHALVQPMSMEQVSEQVLDWLKIVWHDGNNFIAIYHFINWFYALVLCFWGPIYVAAGFGLYINARTQAEAWDIRLRFRQTGKRLGHYVSLVLVAMLCWCLAGTPDAQAEPLPNRAQAAQTQQQVLGQAPFPTIETSRDVHPKMDFSDFLSGIQSLIPSNPGSGFNFFVYVLVAALVVVVAFFLWRWLSVRITKPENDELLPKQLFGLDLTEKAWPADIVAEARRLWPKDARKAMALLYGGSLREAHKRYALSLRDSDTEQEILRRVRKQCSSNLHGFWRLLTTAWIQSAYAHRLPENTLFDDLCRQYGVLFAGVRS